MSGGTAFRFQTRHARRRAERKKEGSRSDSPPPLPRLDQLSSEQIADLRVHGDACRRDHTCEAGGYVSRGIVGIQPKWPGTLIPIRTQCNLFDDVSRASCEPHLGRQIGGERIASPGKVIELVFVGIFLMFQTPRQKSPSCGGRPEFMISVLSLQTTSALSITVSGMEAPFCIGGLGDYRGTH
jgi:hypothetical protein